MVAASSSRPVLVTLTLLVTWLVWGSSFVAITWALESFPPLLLMATRFVAAGAVATAVGLLLARRAGQPMPSRRAWRDASLIGFGFIAIGMGATGWSATRLPTGIAALLVASAPLWIVVLQLIASRGRSRDSIALLGIAIGLAGVGVLVAPGGSQSIDAFAAIVLVVANAAWAAATLFAPRAEKAGGLLLGVGMQMLSGGLQLGVVALASGEGARLDLGSISALALGGWTYLVLAASIGGFLAYGWLLDNVSAGTASTHAFVNPLVAVALGVAVLGERLDERMLVAGGAVIVAVVLLLAAEARAAAAAKGMATAVGAAPVDGLDVAPAPTVRPTPRRTRAGRAVAIGRPVVARHTGRRAWSPTPTPAFARRREARPWSATDGMDALAIDAAFDAEP